MRYAESRPWCKECGNAIGEKATLFPGFQLLYSQTIHAHRVIVFGHLQGGRSGIAVFSHLKVRKYRASKGLL